MSIRMGLDQHRAQITTEWVDTWTGEVSRARVAPADRAGVRRFLERFDGAQLEVALEASTGWRFVIEELRSIDARVHLAEPAETAALGGNKEARQERPGGPPAPAPAADGGQVPGVIPPARSPPQPARPGQAASHAL